MIQLQTATNPATLPLTYLGYSLLIILVCIIALGKVVRKWQLGRFPQGFRMVQGLIVLSILRLVVFLLTYFYWRLEPTFSPSLLVVDQAASLIGILIIFWLWNFPEPSREVDPAAIGLMAVIAALVVAQIILIPDLLEGFTGTITFWQGLSLTALMVGSGLVLIRKPNLWIYGLFMGGILILGTVISLLSDDLNPLHLAQLTAYPLLLVLGDRFPIGERLADEQAGEDDSRRRFSVDFNILALIQKLFDEKDPAGILYKIAQSTAYLILADLTLVIDTPDEHGKMRIIAGYDLIREEPMQALTLDSRDIPLLSNYIQRGKLLHIPASSTSRDLSHLSKMLQLTKPGHLLAAPVRISGTNKTIGVVLFSPFSNRPWTKDDQNYITLLCKLFEAAFSHHLISQDGESDSVKNTIRDLTSQLTQLTTGKQLLKDEVAVLSKDHQNLLLDHDILQNKYGGLLSWGNSLERHLAMLVDLSEKESTEALRKYIRVIEKEVQQTRDEQSKVTVDREKVVAESRNEEVDPDSTRPAALSEAIQNCLEDVQSDLDKKQLTASLDLPKDPPLLKMNHALFQEVFSFLVANAIEETKAGGEIKIRTQIYQEDQSQHFAHIKITDQGDGYFPDEIAAVLNDHLTTEQQEKLNQVMTNLFVTKNLVENEGGRMWVESKPGEGTTVSLLLAFL
jgi:GAF domain-containing protein